MAHFSPTQGNVGELWCSLSISSFLASLLPHSVQTEIARLKTFLLWLFSLHIIKNPPCPTGSSAIIVTARNASHFSLRLGLSGWFIIYRSGPFDGNASAVPLDYQMVKFNLAHLNAFAAFPLGALLQLGAGSFLLFNQPTEAAQLRDKQKVKMTLHLDSQFLNCYTILLLDGGFYP